jgi:hypothetical protein
MPEYTYEGVCRLAAVVSTRERFKVAEKKARTAPMCESIVAIRLFAPGFSSFDAMTFSTARTTPSLARMPIEVPPFSTALTAYSTWKLRPSGEKMELRRS